MQTPLYLFPGWGGTWNNIDLSMMSLLDTPTTLREGVNECGDLFPKTSLLQKTHQLAITINSLLIVFIYNQLNFNTYQQHISAIYHQQGITKRNTKNTRCMYNFPFITNYNPWGFSETTEQSTTLQENQLYNSRLNLHPQHQLR